jgi:hypothetical protein
LARLRAIGMPIVPSPMNPVDVDATIRASHVFFAV